MTHAVDFRRWLEAGEASSPLPAVLYHGSNSEQFDGPIRVQSRDHGWFGTGFYLTAYPEYALRWGRNVFEMRLPPGKYAEVRVVGNYSKLVFMGDAEAANQAAGGTVGWIENEALWARRFTDHLKKTGHTGVRVHFDEHPDMEVLVFDPSHAQVTGRLPANSTS
jgi:hypothetical protein